MQNQNQKERGDFLDCGEYKTLNQGFANLSLIRAEMNPRISFLPITVSNLPVILFYLHTLLLILINLIPTATLNVLINNLLAIENAYTICLVAPSGIICGAILTYSYLSLNQLGCFTYFFFHAVLMLASSVSIALKLLLAVRSKRELTHASSKIGDKSGAGTGGSRREIQAAITVCTVALMQFLAYFPTAATCMAVCLANESPQFAQVCGHLLDLQDYPNLYSIITVGYDMGTLTFSVEHLWNFYIYMLCVSLYSSCMMKKQYGSLRI